MKIIGINNIDAYKVYDLWIETFMKNQQNHIVTNMWKLFCKIIPGTHSMKLSITILEESSKKQLILLYHELLKLKN